MPEAEPIPPLIITSQRQSSLRARYVTYGPIPYYPNTHPEGYVYIYCIQDECRSVDDIIDNVKIYPASELVPN